LNFCQENRREGAEIVSETRPEKKPAVMGTVDKALNLLGYFSFEKPEYGLSELAREAGLDKATALRILNSLALHGFVEQHPESKKYRLGSGILRLARIREASFPIVSVVQPILDHLAEATGETAHASVIAGDCLITIGVAEPQRSTRVFVDPAEMLPLHATASGFVYLGFSKQGTLDDVLTADEFIQYTEETPVSAADIRQRAEAARANGYARAESYFESEVIGIAAPIFNWSGFSMGAIAVASVASRVTPESEDLIISEVVKAANRATKALGGEPHATLIKAERDLTVD
jgi:IclR family transcriptional regulator, acetate operon repressor